MKQSPSDCQIVIETIAQVEPEQGFALCREHRLVLEGDVDRLSRVDDALVDDGDDSHRIVNGIV